MSNDKTTISNVIAFTRGGQIFRNEAGMFSQNIGFILGTIALCLFVIPFVWFAILSNDTQMNSYFLNWIHVLYETLGVTDRLIVKVITYDGPVTTTLGERYTVPGYNELLAECRRMVRLSWLVGISSTLILISLYFYITRYIGKKVTKDKHLRGMSVTSYDSLKKQIITLNKKKAITLGIDENESYHINGIPYPLTTETQHTFLGGSTGSGKTNYLRYLLRNRHHQN